MLKFKFQTVDMSFIGTFGFYSLVTKGFIYNIYVTR